MRRFKSEGGKEWTKPTQLYVGMVSQFTFLCHYINRISTLRWSLKARCVPGQPLKPFLVRPIHKADYFEQRQPFSVIAFLKTPYGMMIGERPFTVDDLSLRLFVFTTAQLRRLHAGFAHLCTLAVCFG